MGGRIAEVARKTFGKPLQQVAQGFAGFVHLEVEVVAVGIPQGLGFKVQVGRAQKGLFGWG